jgi:hypothetical protein
MSQLTAMFVSDSHSEGAALLRGEEACEGQRSLADRPVTVDGRTAGLVQGVVALEGKTRNRPGQGSGVDWTVTSPGPKLASVCLAPVSKGTGQSRTDLATGGGLGNAGRAESRSTGAGPWIGLVMDTFNLVFAMLTPRRHRLAALRGEGWCDPSRRLAH